jgi:hypothetical protein
MAADADAAPGSRSEVGRFMRPRAKFWYAVVVVIARDPLTLAKVAAPNAVRPS